MVSGEADFQQARQAIVDNCPVGGEFAFELLVVHVLVGVNQRHDATFAQHRDSVRDGVQVSVVVLSRFGFDSFPNDAQADGVKTFLGKPVGVVLVEATGFGGVGRVFVHHVDALGEDGTAAAVGVPFSTLPDVPSGGDGGRFLLAAGECCAW